MGSAGGTYRGRLARRTSPRRRPRRSGWRRFRRPSPPAAPPDEVGHDADDSRQLGDAQRDGEADKQEAADRGGGDRLGEDEDLRRLSAERGVERPDDRGPGNAGRGRGDARGDDDAGQTADLEAVDPPVEESEQDAG